MRVPDATNYRKYVRWPESIGNEKNQIRDGTDQPGMIFECATPHSMVLRVGNIDSSAGAMLLEFNFDQEDFSQVRVAPFVTIADQFAADYQSVLSRLDFFKLYAGIAPASYVKHIPEKLTKTMEERFFDLAT